MPKLLYFENGRKLFLELGGEPVVVGRAEECRLRLAGSDVSRRHCRVVRSGGGYAVQDLGSQNGTRVNGERVEERPLRPGDRIEVGSAVLFFDRTGHAAVDGETGEKSAGALDLTFHRSKEIYGAGPDTVEDWRREREQLLRLSDVAMALAHETDLAALLERIMDAAVALSGAERGFVILFEGESLEVKVSRNLRRETLSRPEFSVSRSVVQKVAVTGRSVCLSDAAEAEGFEEAQSIVNLGLRSVLCVPLLLQGKTLGALYLDHCTKRGAFGTAEERLLRLFGSQAAVALDSAQLREKDRDRARLEHEVALASRIQKRLLPAAAPRVHGLAVHGVTIPARAV
ncbi:MAG: GAF domain-containing protein, partial [Planctomycetales bacterium]|nr:GAF domain-containing protein [Planctomycetales bacterium]